MWRSATLAMALLLAAGPPAQAQPPGPETPASRVTALRAGRLADPETGTIARNQIILIEGERISAVGPDVRIPPGARVIDLSHLTVLPGLVDAHTHQALTYKRVPENNIYFRPM